MDKRLQTQTLALAMHIIGTKDPNQFKQVMSAMSENGRNKFLTKCAEIVQSGDTSEENLKLAQVEAQKAIQEGQQAILAKNGSRITYLNHFYTGGKIRTYDGGIMTIKKPLTKDQVDGKQSIGLYKGKWVFLNKEQVAMPKSNLPQKSSDGSTHINRAYNGMLLPKPQKYSLGGFLSNTWGSIKDGAKRFGQGFIKTYNKVDNFIDNNIPYAPQAIAGLAAFGDLISQMNKKYRSHEGQISGNIKRDEYLMGLYSEGITDYYKQKKQQSLQNGSPGTQGEEQKAKNDELIKSQLNQRLKQQLPIPTPQLDINQSLKQPEQPQFPNLEWDFNPTLQYPIVNNELKLNY